MTLEVSEMPIVQRAERNQSGGYEPTEVQPEEITKVSEEIEVEKVDKLADAAEIKKMRERFGYDDKVSESAKKIMAQSDMNIETFVRFRNIVGQAQFAVNLFTDQDMLPSLNALLRPGTKLGEPGSIWYENLYDNGVYGDYLNKLIPILQEIKDANTGGNKLTIGQVKGFVQRLRDLDVPQSEEILEYYREQGKTSGKDEDLVVLQKLGERARDFLLKNGYEDNTEAYNLEEVVGIMMLSSDNKFRTGHERELMNAKGEVQLHNLLAWFYDQLTYFSDFQDDDPLAQYQSIGFYTSFRQITAAELIIYNPKRYFAHRVYTGQKKFNPQQTRKEEAGWIPIYETDNNYRPYTRLRDYLVTVLTNSGLAHDYGIQYEKVKEDRDKFHENMRQIYGEERSEFGNRMLRWLNLLGTSKEEVYRYLESTSNDHEAGGTIGQATRQTLLAYYYFDQLGYGEKDNKDLKDPNANNMFIKALGEGKNAFFHSLILQAVTDNDVIRLVRQDVERKIFEAKQKAIDEGRVFNIQDLINSDEEVRIYREYQDKLIGDPLRGISGILTNSDTGLAADNIVSLLRANKGIFLSLHKYLGISTTAVEKALDSGDDVDVALGLADSVRGYSRKKLNFFDSPVKVIVRKEEKEFVMNALNDAIRTHFIKIQPNIGMSSEEAAYVKEFSMLMPGWLGIASKNDTSTNSLTFWTTMLNFFDYRKDHMSQVYTGETETLNSILRFMTPLEALCVQVRDPRTKEPIKTMNLLEYLQGGQGATLNVETNRYARGEFTVNTGKKYWQEHLGGMVKMREFFYNNRGLDLGDIVKHQRGTGEVTIDPEKLKKFKEFWSAARNAFAKNGDVRWDTKLVVRRRLTDAEKKRPENKGKDFVFEEKTLAEMVFHKNVIGAFNNKTGKWEGGMDVNHGHTPSKWQADIDSGKDRSKQGELFVRDLIGFGLYVSFYLHKFRLNPFTMQKYLHKDPLWEKWEMGEFRHVHEFFKHLPLGAEEEEVAYGRKWWKFWRREGAMSLYRMHEPFFTDDDLYDVEKRSKTRYWDFLRPELGLGTSGSIFLLLWQLFLGTMKEGLKFK